MFLGVFHVQAFLLHILEIRSCPSIGSRVSYKHQNMSYVCTNFSKVCVVSFLSKALVIIAKVVNRSYLFLVDVPSLVQYLIVSVLNSCSFFILFFSITIYMTAVT